MDNIKWNQIIIEMEDNWHESAEYKYLPLETTA
jgi:hypothetical protein